MHRHRGRDMAQLTMQHGAFHGETGSAVAISRGRNPRFCATGRTFIDKRYAHSYIPVAVQGGSTEGVKREMTARLNRVQFLAALVAFTGISLLSIGVVQAQATGDVSVTVSASAISFTISDGFVAFGSQELGDTVDTVSDLDVQDERQTITNGASSVPIDALQASYDTNPEAECGTNDWSASLTANGANQFRLRVDDNGDFATTAAVPPDGALSSNVFSTTLAVSGVRDLDFELLMPTTITGVNASCIIAITFTASSG
jgi:hypothetical protein